ncbi:MAG: NGG1p interacting factor NIF3 [Elusimicrobiota bacterium]|nr:NGG1p interacting factor NIF3 [Elusimicrobiota bacterium]
MKIKDIQELFVKEGIEVDPRGKDLVALDLKKRKKNYDDLSKEQKENFDIESLENPYYDSRILYSGKDPDIKNIVVGIDIETPEILLTKQLKDSGRKIDLIVAHHPEGYAYSTFSNVIYMQSDILFRQGIAINISEKLISPRVKEVERSVYPQNNERVSDAAKILDIPFMTAHSVADNHVASFLQKEFDALNPVYLIDIIDFLNKQPEYIHSSKVGQAPVILLGDKTSRCGKIFVDMTGGTEGPIESFEKLSQAGVGTIVGMHLSQKAVKEAQKHKINVILAGHISSDNLGLNLLFDKLEKKFGKLEFVEISGFRRFRR